METIISKAKGYLPETTKLLSSIISSPSTSGNEKGVVDRLISAFNKIGCDEVRKDGLGSFVARIGNGKRVIAIDAHIDCVDIGDKSQWNVDPFSGIIKNGKLFGRGAADQKSGMASMYLAAKLIKELKLLPDDVSLYFTGTVMEEDCDGLCWKYLIEQEKIKPEVCVITEPTSLRVNRGHRGRLELQISTKGVSAHGSAPERGVNAVYKMASVIKEIEKMGKINGEEFLGKGTVVVSNIKSSGPSLCAVPDFCEIYLDRRLGLGETKENVIKEIIQAAKRAGVDVEVKIPIYDGLAYTGKKYSMEKYFPAWLINEDHKAVKAMSIAGEASLSKKPEIHRWTFSTNATVICGQYNIPCVGFGPGNEEQAHAPNEWVDVNDLWKAAIGLALFPREYLKVGEKS